VTKGRLLLEFSYFSQSCTPPIPTSVGTRASQPATRGRARAPAGGRWTLVLPRWRTPHWGRGGGAWAAPGLPWSKFFELGPIRRYMHPVSAMEYDQYVTLRQKCGLPPGAARAASGCPAVPLVG
jgi:hypothetical protein